MLHEVSLLFFAFSNFGIETYILSLNCVCIPFVLLEPVCNIHSYQFFSIIHLVYNFDDYRRLCNDGDSQAVTNDDLNQRWFVLRYVMVNGH